MDNWHILLDSHRDVQFASISAAQLVIPGGSVSFSFLTAVTPPPLELEVGSKVVQFQFLDLTVTPSPIMNGCKVILQLDSASDSGQQSEPPVP